MLGVFIYFPIRHLHLFEAVLFILLQIEKRDITVRLKHELSSEMFGYHSRQHIALISQFAASISSLANSLRQRKARRSGVVNSVYSVSRQRQPMELELLIISVLLTSTQD